MPKAEISVSIPTYDEILNALDAKGIRLAPDTDIVLTKDIKIIAPVNYKQVTIRRDVLEQVAKVYKAPIDGDFEITDSEHFINFFNDVYNYVLKGERPAAKNKTEIVPIKKAGW